MPVSFKKLLDEFELMTIGNPLGEYRVVLCRQTGKIYVHSSFPDSAELEEELPDDIDDDEKYIALPDKRDLDLGKPLVLDFACEFLPKDFDEVRDIFNRRGAYQNFKALLARRKMTQQWYDYEAKATENALRSWCELNSVAVTD